ncbi:MAG: ribosome maturation factor RimP [Desulfobaccales bacterium]|jgi:ribosome maturation factor RimP
MQTKEEIITRVKELVEPLLEAQGVELVDLVYARPRRSRATLRLFLDQPGGISLEVLTRISRVIGELLDVHDSIPGSYHLEVSSPGLTRPLRRPEDYQRYCGRLVRLTTHTLWEGRQVHRGILLGLEGETVCLRMGEETCRIPLQEIARARLELDLKNHRKEG